MSRFLLVIAVFIVCYLILRNFARRSDAARPGRGAPGEGASGQASGPSRLGEDMVRCAVCGVHLPTSEAVTSRGDFFCSKEHLQLALRDRERG